MDQFLHIVFIYLHVLGVVLFVGPQVFLAVGWAPVSRRIDDHSTRVMAMRTITDRFLYLAGFGLLLAVGAGLYLISTWRSYHGIPDDVAFMSLRFGVVFVTKMVLLALMLIAVAVHSFWTGPRFIDAFAEEAPEATLRGLRLRSMALSIAGLGLALVIMVLGVMLNTAQWSLQ